MRRRAAPAVARVQRKRLFAALCFRVRWVGSQAEALGVQVVAGSNPVAPTIKAPVATLETERGGGFLVSALGNSASTQVTA